MNQARTIIEQSPLSLILEEDPEPPKLVTNDELRWPDPWYDNFAYCTWNGLGQDLSERGILSALDTLEKHEIFVSTLIIDDNWQSLDEYGDCAFDRRWTRFEANAEGFPKGLKSAIGAVRDAHTSIKDVAVWHGIFGYWNATAPEGEIAEQYDTRLV